MKRTRLSLMGLPDLVKVDLPRGKPVIWFSASRFTSYLSNVCDLLPGAHTARVDANVDI